jgi:DAK2 domain fusion protein YloV
MVASERFGPTELVAVIEAYGAVLRAHRVRINRLNVYPVPDGDTGTNMALTVDSVIEELARSRQPDLVEVARSVSHGSLMGARGNSGVILSQILRGLAEAIASAPGSVGPAELAAGLRRAADGAYRAVQNPVEGTILTVARAAAEGAEGALGPTEPAGPGDPAATAPPAAPPAGPGLVAVLEAARSAAAAALARTPEMLPVLAAAGVVDSGGSGLLLLFDALLHVADGRPLPESPVEPEGALAEAPAVFRPAARPGPDPDSDATGVADLRYEVMYLLEAPDELIPAFREVWAGVGDSIVVVGGSGLWNCHIHTDDIGAAIEAALEAGRPRQIRVTDLAEAVEEESWVRAAAGREPAEVEEPVRCSVVAVATGDGIRRIFRSLGVHHVVAGGQSMNPSTADILAAVEAARSDEVVVLPNNKNIVAVADQAARQASKPVRVVPTRGIQEGFAALLDYDPEEGAEENAGRMARSAEGVVAGEVTRAVRPSSCEAGPIREGDWLGLSRDRIEVVAPDLASAATGLLDLLVKDDHEIVTVIAGEGAGAADTRRITEWLAEHRPRAAAEVHHGGQPLYPYLFSIE